AEEYVRRALQSMRVHCEAMVALMRRGAVTFDYGNNLRGQAKEAGYADAFAFPGFVPAYVRPLFCEGKGPFRWVALSGDPTDIYATDRAVMDLFPDNEHLVRWLQMAGEKVAFQGLPARICWLGYGERARAGLKFNDMVAQGIVKAPIVIGRDHLDSGSVACPHHRPRTGGGAPRRRRLSRGYRVCQSAWAEDSDARRHEGRAMNVHQAETIALDGASLTLEQVLAVAYGRPGVPRVVLSAAAITQVARAANAVQRLLAQGTVAYGITTGFG